MRTNPCPACRSSNIMVTLFKDIRITVLCGRCGYSMEYNVESDVYERRVIQRAVDAWNSIDANN